MAPEIVGRTATLALADTSPCFLQSNALVSSVEISHDFFSYRKSIYFNLLKQKFLYDFGRCVTLRRMVRLSGGLRWVVRLCIITLSD